MEELQTGPRNEDIATARAQVKEMEEQLKLEHLKRTRRKYLYDTGAISKQQYAEVAFNSNALFERLSANGYWLPISALVQGKRGLWSCYALTETENSPKNLSLANANATKPYRVERRDVEVVHTEGDRVLVRGAIESGENVINRRICRIGDHSRGNIDIDTKSVRSCEYCRQ